MARKWRGPAGLFLLLALLGNQTLVAQQTVPEIPFESVPNLLKLPAGMYLGEASAVAVNSKGNIFVFSRGNTTGPAYAAAASQLLEFGPDGRFIREIGKNLYGFAFAHGVRVDKNDNIWTVDKGTDMIVKFSPEGKVLMVFGRRQEASDEGTGPLKHPNPPLPPVDMQFRQPTDVAWDAAGNSYISDGYINSRVAKIDKNGVWVKSWGEPGDKPGQFATLHNIATDAQGRVYVADRSNRRIQVFDGDGTFLHEFRSRYAIRSKHSCRHRQHATARSAEPAGCALGRLHYARAKPGFVHGGFLPRPNLQTKFGWEGPGRSWSGWASAETVRLDPWNGVPVGK